MKLLTTVGLAIGARAVAAEGIAFANAEEAGDKEMVRLDRRDEAVPYGVNALEGDSWNKRKRDHDDSDSEDGDDREHLRRRERDNDRFRSKDYMFGHTNYGDGDDYNRHRGELGNRYLPEYRPDRYNPHYMPPSPWNKVRDTELHGLSGAELIPQHQAATSGRQENKSSSNKNLQQLGMGPGSGGMMHGNMMGGGLRGGMMNHRMPPPPHSHHHPPGGPGMHPGAGRHFMSAGDVAADPSVNNLRAHDPAQSDRKFNSFGPMMGDPMYANAGMGGGGSSFYPESFPPMMDRNMPGFDRLGGPMPGMMMGGPMMPPPPFMMPGALSPGMMNGDFLDNDDMFGDSDSMRPGFPYRRGFAEQRAAKPF